jgi:probable H4MPT-linked C1 transfer pathway protein
MSWLGLDIGGANLKAATPQGWACSTPFALWRNPQGLASALKELLDRAPACDKLAVTMSGELCDCFRNKAEGVRHILEAVENVAGDRKVLVYLVDGRFVSTEEAKASPRLAAASNWHALAAYAARYVPRGRGLLIDIGSTTTDVVPMRDGKVVARGRTDTERLLSSELVYQGVGRTPVCAVVRALPCGDRLCPVASEVFASTADAYLLLGYVAEDPAADWTADGRGLTKYFAKCRLARQICADTDEIPESSFEVMASAIRDSQLAAVTDAIAAVSAGSDGPGCCVTSGSGEFLAREALAELGTASGLTSLRDEFGSAGSQSAPGLAVAILAREAFG